MIRLYTEDVNREGTLAILDARFDAYTVIPAIGRWRGKSEATLIIELDGVGYFAANQVAQEIRKANNQEAILLTVESRESILLT